MEYNKQLPMTLLQMRVFEEIKQNDFARYEELKRQKKEALAAIVSLPHVNEHGDKVIASCNNQMARLAECCEQQMSVLRQTWWELK